MKHYDLCDYDRVVIARVLLADRPMPGERIYVTAPAGKERIYTVSSIEHIDEAKATRVLVEVCVRR